MTWNKNSSKMPITFEWDSPTRNPATLKEPAYSFTMIDSPSAIGQNPSLQADCQSEADLNRGFP